MTFDYTYFTVYTQYLTTIQVHVRSTADLTIIVQLLHCQI